MPFDPGPHSALGDVLAGEASADEVNMAPPGPTVEFGNVVPDGSQIQRPVSLAGLQDVLAGFLDLDVADGLEAAGTSEPKGKAPDPAEEVECSDFIHDSSFG